MSEKVKNKDQNPSEVEQPPLGLRPRFIATEQRIQEIKEACQRYREADYIIPTEWLTELCDLKQYLHTRQQ